MRRTKDSRGSATIEVVALVPLIVLVALMVLQLGVAGWTSSEAQRAVRDAARAQSTGGDPGSAAEHSLPGTLDVKNIATTSDSVTIWVEVPRVAPLPKFTVKRHVAMPSTGL